MTDSDFKTFLKTPHREEMEFVIIGGLDRKVRQEGMIKPSIDLQELRRRIYRKAKADRQMPTRRASPRRISKKRDKVFVRER